MKWLFLVLLLCVCPFVGTSGAEDLYIAQTATGGDTGVDCANAHAVTFFNSAANWGGGAGEIDPGDTVHVCGTITCSAIQTDGLVTQAAGTSGNPITIKFETGAVMTCGVWGTNDGTRATGGAIRINHDFITVDGGTNGVIRNTANGQGLANSVISAGVTYSSSNVEIKNLTIQDIWVKTPYSDVLVGATNGILGTNAPHSSILIHHNTIDDGSDLITHITATTGSNSNIQIYNNVLSRTCTGIVIASAGVNSVVDNVQVYGNEMFDGYVWWGPADECHINGMHLFAAQSGTDITNLKVYNNYAHSNMSTGCGVANCYTHVTAFIFIEGTGGGTITAPKIFNNLLVAASGDGASNGLLYCGLCTNPEIYNNTILGQVADGIVFDATGIVLRNNIISNFDHMIYAPGSSTVSASNNNLFNAFVNGWTVGGTTYGTFAAWQGAGFDASGLSAAPDLNATTFKPNSGSPTINAGANLTSLGITALNSDKAGVARPSSGAWEIGAYEFLLGTQGGVTFGIGWRRPR